MANSNKKTGQEKPLATPRLRTLGKLAEALLVEDHYRLRFRPRQPLGVDFWPPTNWNIVRRIALYFPGNSAVARRLLQQQKTEL
jgi:hypothetical protein